MKKITLFLSWMIISALAWSQQAEKEAKDIIANSIVQALQQEDTALLIARLMPGQQDFERLIKATYASNPEVLKDMNLTEGRTLLAGKIKESFLKLLQTGKDAGIRWADIQLAWAGESADRDGEVYQSKFPFHFKHGESEYRVVVDFCTQLADDPLIISLGEFRWEGKYK